MRLRFVALVWGSALVSLAGACASSQEPEGPSPEEVCAAEAEQLDAWVAAVAGSRNAWWWEPAGSVVTREGDAWPDEVSDALVAIEVDRDGAVSPSRAEAATFDGAAAAADTRPLGVAFHADVRMRRVQQVLRRLEREGVNEVDLLFHQYRPVGPQQPSGARPLIDRLDDCGECEALRAQLRVRIAGECAPLGAAMWPDLDATGTLDERVAASRRWSKAVRAALGECACAGVDIDALWDLAWNRLSRPAPLTAVRVVFAGRRRQGVRTIALDGEMRWSDAHQAFAEADGHPVVVTSR
jgi:hypothetical protein